MPPGPSQNSIEPNEGEEEEPDEGSAVQVPSDFGSLFSFSLGAGLTIYEESPDENK